MVKTVNSKTDTSASKYLLFARQPIFDGKNKLYAFELLYRDNDPHSAVFDDGDKATSALIINY
jgi:EAL and modified HD-GYP domain-containing signal transduction protein